jgi:hypothetical protein
MCSCTGRGCAPHRLIRLHVGASLDQSLDNIRVPIHGSPHQGRPVLLRDEYTSRGCNIALSDKAVVTGVLRDKIGSVRSSEMQEVLTY